MKPDGIHQSPMPWRRASQADTRPMGLNQKVFLGVTLLLALAAYAITGIEKIGLLTGLAVGFLTLAFGYFYREERHRVISIFQMSLLLPTAAAMSFFAPSNPGNLIWIALATSCAATWNLSKHQSDATKTLPMVLFIATCALLRSESLSVIALLGFATLFAIAGAAWSTHIENSTNTLAKSAGRLFVFSVLAAPMGMLIFFLYPRTAFDFNQANGGQSKASMGLSSTMSPGSFSELVLSNKLAFNASFYAETIPKQTLYWRASVLSKFDGKTWSEAGPGAPGFDQRSESELTKLATASNADVNASAESAMKDGGEGRVQSKEGSKGDIGNIGNIGKGPVPPLFYSIDVPESLGQFFPLLDVTTRGSAKYTREIKDARDPQGLKAEVAIKSDGSPVFAAKGAFPVQIRAAADFTRAFIDSAGPGPHDTEIPQKNNLRTQALARQWRDEAAGNADALVDRFSRHIRTNNFIYTLKPPAWKGDDGIDQFFFDNQKGFCEHYASTFVYFMRAAGVPARVISGFSGGDVVGNEVHVLSRDAHAWAEVWIPEAGWRRVDPTSFIDPSRVEAQTRDTLARSMGWDTLSQIWLAKIENIWNQTILYYNADARAKFIKDWLGRPLEAATRVLMFAALLLLCFGVSRAITHWQSRRLLTGEQKQALAYQDLIMILRHQGWRLEPSSTPRQALRCLQDKDASPHAARGMPRPSPNSIWLVHCRRWIETYEKNRYGHDSEQSHEMNLKNSVFHHILVFGMKASCRVHRL